MAAAAGRPETIPTIYDVAAHAGVSVSTVSRALNEPSRVRAVTRDRVYAAVRELGFELRADAAARARKRSRRIGVRGQFTSHGSYLERLQGVLAAAREDDCEIVVYDEESFVLHPHVVDTLAINGWLDGIILMGVPMSQALAERLVHETFKTVLVGLNRPGFSSVDVDDAEGGRLAADYLASRGRQRCAYLGNPAGDADAVEIVRTPEQRRLDGFRSGLRDAGLDLPDELVLSQHPFPTTQAAAAHLLTLEHPPSAVFACADDLAAEVMKVARQLGRRVPDDVAVIGFDDREYAGYLGLTTIRQPLFESGRIAYRLLQERLNATPAGATTTVTLPLTIIPRETA